MFLFGKQDEQRSSAPSDAAGHGGYGIADLIRLLKVIPTDHHPQLVVQVIKTTLESVGVKSSAVIEDATIRENGMRDAIEMLGSQIVALRQEIHDRQEQMAQLDIALRETIGAKNLLVSAEMASDAPPEIDLNQAQFVEDSDFEARSLPPPLPPPRRKIDTGQLHQSAQGR
jgi:hypothetical protein